MCRGDAARHSRALFAAAGLAGALGALAPAVCAQVIQLGTWEGAVEGQLDLVRTETGTGSSTSRHDDGLLGERLSLHHAGLSLFDPQFLSLSLGGTFGLSQEWLSQETEDSVFREGTLGSYDAFTSLLSGQPTSVNLFAGRQQSIFLRELAGRSEVVNERRGVTVFARRLPLPSSFTLRQEHDDERSRSAEVESFRDNRKTIFTYEGQRGWLDADADLRYESIDSVDAITPILGFQSHEASARYGRDFGMELNRHWDSRLRYFTRDGATDLTTWTLEDSLRTEHSKHVQSTARYLLTQQETAGNASTAHAVSVDLQHRLYDNLTTTLGSDALVDIVPGGQKRVFRGRLDEAYTRRLPSNGQLSVSLGGGLEYEDDQFASAVSVVLQESHTMAELARPVLLENPFVAAASVVVTKVAVGPLPVGCFPPAGPPLPLVLGRDYTLRVIGGDLTQLVPISCAGTTPGVNPGDTLAVDYQYDTARALTFLTGRWHLDLSADYNWIRLYGSHAVQIPHLVAGQDDRFLDEQQSDTLGIELRKDGPRVHGSVLGEAGRITSGRVDYDQLQSLQIVNVILQPELTLAANADEALLMFTDEDRQAVTMSQQVTLTYAPADHLSVEGLVGTRQLRDSLSASERTVEATLKLLWFLRSIELNSILGMLRREREDVTTQELHLSVKFVRRF